MPVSTTLTTGREVAEKAAQKLTTAVNGSQTREYLSGHDNIFLFVEDEIRPMNVSGLYTFGPEITEQDMKGHIASFVDNTLRCRQRLVRPAGVFARPYWEVAEDYDLEDHFTVIEVAAPGGDDEFMEAVAPLHTTLLDTSKPLWHAFWFNNLKDGKKALLWTAHHAIGDGQGFVRALISHVASLDPTIKDISSLQYSAGHASGRSTPEPSRSSTPSPDGKAVAVNGCTAPARKHSPAHGAVAHFTGFYVALFTFLVGLYMYLANITRFLISRRKLYTVGNHKTSRKQVAWTTINSSLDDVKKIKNALGVSVNDVLTACVVAALDAHAKSVLSPAKHDKGDDAIWLLIPTSMRHPADTSASNRSSGYVLGVPNKVKDIRERIKKVNSLMSKGKQSPEALVHYLAQGPGYAFPNSVPKLTLFTTTKLHGVLTNVPGPNTTLRWAGHPIQSTVAFIPQANANTVSCAAYTYNGAVTLSVVMDLHEGDVLKTEEGRVFAKGAAKDVARQFEKIILALVEEVDAEHGVKVQKTPVAAITATADAPLIEVPRSVADESPVAVMLESKKLV
ncbi:wax ester synthase-like acyl-CoA acyltransferase domain-containing protein [Fimicolochytrium jonesii]|uniref:wax ester synthase-like acyl-CoA acyltransferase domain-containing protein n=1 Tax=Fimicolochytrium jonesii TaxID=1396493 RepID=UPI0022FE026D|nr:wax ester synthase-like acyl-CoA acyltransferase domain-containing protein [Fimicolochytrium jonesii]KAI8826795.1 wax ester synthase-like acyl-CoA acyltransferase domain-containing protein [Fimicolochytrium jonesii]